MIEHVVLDCDGEPVTIENGRILCAEPPRDIWSDSLNRYVDREDDDEYDVDDIYWDSDICEWRATFYRHEPSDAKLYGASWYDCNTDWRSWNR